MHDERAPRERFERIRTSSRQTRGGAGCCGCCAGATVFAVLATAVGLTQLLGWGRDVISQLDPDQRLGLAILLLLALAAFVFAAWRMRPRLRRTTTVITRVSTRPPADDDNREPLRLDIPLDTQWRPADPGEGGAGDEQTYNAGNEQEGGA